MSYFNTYISVQREWIAGRGFNNSFTISFTLDGSPFDISNYTFALAIRRIGGETNILSLSQGSGITNGGASGVLTIQITEAQTESIDADSYFYSIDYLIGGLGYSLFHGTFNLLKDYNPNAINNAVTVPVSLAGTEVSADVTLSGNTGRALYVDTTTVGNVGAGEDDLKVYTVPANLLSSNGQVLIASCTGSIAANANAKVIKVYFGSTVIFNSGSTFDSGEKWNLEIEIVRTGATSQKCCVKFYGDISVTDTVTYTSTSEILSNALDLTITGQSLASANNDVVAEMLVVNAEVILVREDTDTRSISVTSTATLTPNINLYDLFIISAQAAALIIANPTGTAVLGNGFMIDLEDDGSARAITYGNLYDDTFVDLPSTTIAGKRMKLVFQYNGTNWELLNVINEQ